jgi:hypothetical protein
MTPQEKAKELVDKYNYEICNSCGLSENESSLTAAKVCAIICVNELIDLSDRVSDIGGNYKDAECELKFWYMVKNEINKL